MFEFELSGFKAVVDKDDCGLFPLGKLRINDDGYVVWSHKGKSKFLHKVIAGASKGFVVHHKNGNKLDNRKCNLQRLTPSQHATSHVQARYKEFEAWAEANIKGPERGPREFALYCRITKKVATFTFRKK